MTVAMRILSLLLAALVLALPVTASAQGQVGSVTITKLPTTLDTPGVHPVRFELTGGDLTAPLILYSDTDTVRFSDLTPGTYHVREIATRTGDVARGTTAPFTVTIPQGELFDVTVYPKIQPLMLTKSSDVTAVAPGSRFTYLLDGSVPLPDTNGQLHRYVLRDALPEGVTPTGPYTAKLRNGTRTVNLTKDVHYTVTTNDDRVVTATFTPAGLELLARERADHADLTVRFAFGVRASTEVTPGTRLINVAHLYPDGYPVDGAESVISNEHVLPVVGDGGSSTPGIPGVPGVPALPGSSGSVLPVLPVLSSSPGGTPGAPGTPGADVPGTPGSAPGAPGTSTHAGSPDRPTRAGGLASTGASVLGMVALGAALTMAGITVMKRGRRD